MTRRILFVDDEPKILQALERQLSDKFDIRTAPGPEQGWTALIDDGHFAVVVSDFRMPGMNGIEFLSRVKLLNADTVRVMLTGQADLTIAIAAVNEGSIFRFLTKPCSPEILNAALVSALEQHRLITSERELLEKTLSGSIKILTEVLSLVNPGAFSHACVIRKYATHMATCLKLTNVWEFELAAMLCPLGYITIPQAVLDRVAVGEVLTADEQAVFSGHPAVAERLLENIPRLETVARIIGNQSSPPSVQERADSVFAGGDAVAMGSAILRTALEFDKLASSRKSRCDALSQMRKSGLFPVRLLDALETAEVDRTQCRVQMLRVTELSATMVANQDIHASNGVLLLRKGEELTMPMIEKLRGFAKTFGVPEPVNVLVHY